MYNTTKKLKGLLEIGGDKSISHRALILGSIIKGCSTIENLSKCDDVLRTMTCLEKCNIKITNNGSKNKIFGGTLRSPIDALNCGNSGSTVRMLLGLLAGQGLKAKFVGDNSLCARPMRRIIDPISNAGAKILHKDMHLPFELKKGIKFPFDYAHKIKSAQVKSSLIFAALGQEKQSTISFNKHTRDHLEKLLKFSGYQIKINNQISIQKPKNIIKGFNIKIPGDISNASFLIAGAIMIPDSEILIKNLVYNKTRFGFINALIKMNANIKISNIRSIGFEDVCDIKAVYTKNLKPIIIEGDEIIPLIDEIPILSIVATQIPGKTIISNAEELRLKESDRIASLFKNLIKMNANIVEKDDGLIIEGGKKLHNTTINDFGDHRILASFEILSILINGSFSLNDSKCIRVSFPEFYPTIKSLLS